MAHHERRSDGQHKQQDAQHLRAARPRRPPEPCGGGQRCPEDRRPGDPPAHGQERAQCVTDEPADRAQTDERERAVEPCSRAIARRFDSLKVREVDAIHFCKSTFEFSGGQRAYVARPLK